MPRKLKQYAVYKGDRLLAIGNVHELAERFGVSEKTVYWWSSPAAKRRYGDGEGKVAEVLE